MHASARAWTGGGAELLRLGENAICRLETGSVVVRIARNPDHWTSAVKEVAIAGWLDEHQISAARTRPADQPIDVDGHPVTFWRCINGRRGGPGDIRALGGLLRTLHQLLAPTSIVLPVEDVLDRVHARIERGPIPSADQAFLLRLLTELTAALGELTYSLAARVTHGDAHVRNLMVTDKGVVLIDFERIAWAAGVGPRDDGDRVRNGSMETDAAFVDSYGFDVTIWDSVDTVRRAHEIKMTTWLMQNVQESPETAEEYERCMLTIRDDRRDVPWRPT